VFPLTADGFDGALRVAAWLFVVAFAALVYQVGKATGVNHPSRREGIVLWLGQVCCGLFGGHEYMLHTENRRGSLMCTNCGKRSPGVDSKVLPFAQALRRKP
jgi:hypothetical protein